MIVIMQKLENYIFIEYWSHTECTTAFGSALPYEQKVLIKWKPIQEKVKNAHYNFM